MSIVKEAKDTDAATEIRARDRFTYALGSISGWLSRKHSHERFIETKPWIVSRVQQSAGVLLVNSGHRPTLMPWMEDEYADCFDDCSLGDLAARTDARGDFDRPRH